jgi:hypothetical protein
MRTSLSLLALGLASACIIPDIDIEVYATQQCGFQYRASSNDAWGVTGMGEKVAILIDDYPITKTWCLSPDEHALMSADQSWIYQQILDDIVQTCKARATELQLGDEHCADKATITSTGPCPGKHAWCEGGDGGEDEVGTPDLPE